MSEENWKLEKNLCRCCHSEGDFKNLADPCSRVGQEEIYCDMLQECLDIIVSPVPGPLCSITYTICEDCILRLRDACSFKQQVTQCEERFHDLYNRDVIKISACFDGLPVKVELDQEDVKIDISRMDEDEDFDLKYDDEDDDDNSEVMDIKEDEKARPKKPQTKEKPKQKRNANRSRKLKSEEGDKSDKDDKKGDPVDEYVKQNYNTDSKFSCKACETAYKRLHDLRYHIIRAHLKSKFIKCSYCPETFMYYSQRRSHVISEHSGERPDDFGCDHCQRRFKRKNTLASHMLDVHIQKKCQFCELRFPKRRYLFHLNESHGVAMPTCGICGLRTLAQSALIRHQRKVHLSEKNVVCNVCKKRFYTKSNLLDHMITHEKSKVYKCDVCTKAFARKEYFKVHYRIHTGEKPYECCVCDARFGQRASLRFHMKSHPGVKNTKK